MINTDIFIKKAKEKHGDKYDYSKVNYVNAKTKVCIICPKHGEFWQAPYGHLNGNGCSECAKENKKNNTNIKYTIDDFIKKAKEKHGDKYDYSKVNYVNIHTKVCIICPEHGEFWQTPNKHLNGNGCKLCGIIKMKNKNKYTLEEFIKKSNKKHNHKYDYSKVDLLNYNMKDKICIICPEHGEFWQTASNHLQGQGCSKCKNNKLSFERRLTNEQFIEKARKVHGDKYDYSKVDYINNHTKVCIICPEHGEFWQTPNKHIDAKRGCHLCHIYALEKEIIDLLNDNKIIFDYQKRFDWLGRQSLDFYLPDYNIAIECQGEQHFKPIEYFGGEEIFLVQKERDIRKKRLCKENKIKLLYYSNIKYNKSIIIDKKILLNTINCL